jgi:hypothetical protein
MALSTKPKHTVEPPIARHSYTASRQLSLLVVKKRTAVKANDIARWWCHAYMISASSDVKFLLTCYDRRHIEEEQVHHQSVLQRQREGRVLGPKFYPYKRHPQAEPRTLHSPHIKAHANSYQSHQPYHHVKGGGTAVGVKPKAKADTEEGADGQTETQEFVLSEAIERVRCAELEGEVGLVFRVSCKQIPIPVHRHIISPSHA